ncbi:MAG: hypothetical protein LBG72_07790 [Spirochaetaceae bacterium]|jgi:hypothetical protein|nr:hypothetical protein [Spirochaetaceae bacterium]
MRKLVVKAAALAIGAFYHCLIGCPASAGIENRTPAPAAAEKSAANPKKSTKKQTRKISAKPKRSKKQTKKASTKPKSAKKKAANTASKSKPKSNTKQKSAKQKSTKKKPVANITLRTDWNPDGYLTNRAALTLHTPAGFDFRILGYDKRPSPPWEETDKAISGFGLGLYNNAWNSRVLYGAIKRQGLPLRVKNVWGHALPFTDKRKTSGGDLKTAISTKEDYAVFVQLGTPNALPAGLYASTLINDGVPADWTGGAFIKFNKKTRLGLEGYYKHQTLPEDKASTWFPDKPRLPERDFAFYAGSLIFNSPYFSLAGDLAYSQVIFSGDDIYANAALRFGSGGTNGWSLSFAADAAGSHFTGSDGVLSGAGFRIGSMFEWKGKSAAAFKTSTVLAAPELGGAFNWSKSALYFHPPVLGKGGYNITSLAFNFARDGKDISEIKDSYEAAALFRAGHFRPGIKYLWQGRTSAETGSLIPYPNPFDDYEFLKSKLSTSLGFVYTPFYLRASVIYEEKEKKAPAWKAALYASFKYKWLFLSGKVEDNEQGKVSCTFTAKAAFAF